MAWVTECYLLRTRGWHTRVKPTASIMALSATCCVGRKAFLGSAETIAAQSTMEAKLECQLQWWRMFGELTGRERGSQKSYTWSVGPWAEVGADFIVPKLPAFGTLNANSILAVVPGASEKCLGGREVSHDLLVPNSWQAWAQLDHSNLSTDNP